MAKRGWRSANLSPDRRVFFGQGRGDVRSRALAARVSASFGSRGGASTADLLFPLIFPPTLISVTPNTGTSAGGTVVDLAGMNFQPGATVTFGGTPATVVSVAPTHIFVNTPAHVSGTVDVTVTNPDLQSSTLIGAYSYTFPSVIVGSGGTVALSSDDGLVWTPRVIPANSYSDVAWNGTVYCAIGQTAAGGAATSSDGINWSAHVLGAPSVGGSWNRIAWNGTLFCTIARNAADTATSPDGTTWTVHTGVLSSGNYGGIASNGSIFVAVGNLGENATSSDGVTWVEHAGLPSGRNFTSVVWNADSGIFCTMPAFEAFFPNPGKSSISSDGASWTTSVVPMSQAWLTGPTGIAWNGSVFVAVGIGQLAGAMTSPNGLLWTNRPSLNNTFEWTFVFWAGSVFVTGTAGGGQLLATSADNGVTWITQACPFVPSAGASPLIGES